MGPIAKLLLLILLTACGTSGLAGYKKEGQKKVIHLTKELKAVKTKHDLQEALPQLKKEYASLMDTLIQARLYEEAHPNEEIPEVDEKDHALSLALQHELRRLSSIEGASPLIEKMQEEALIRLDTLERDLKIKHLRLSSPN